ncbi:MAG: xanthine dehydrogenase accessory protein XdhC [Cellvibrionaceae bacterium]|nr:xanthine dehydrogenase accessory protein XdhC [Cellvibrionaceae bacterium]
MNPPLRWFEAIPLCRAAGKPWVIATLIGTQGSTPRAAGSKMIITADTLYDTLGGGQLEHYISRSARELITQGRDQQKIEYLPLSNKTKQCCGGTVNVLLECFAASRVELHIFGAGHVAKALIKIVGEIDCQVSWIDSRPEMFPAELPSNTQTYCTSEPLSYIQTIQPGAIALVLTHDHALDYRLITALLDYANCEFIGLIGSKAKAQRFKKRLKSESFSPGDIDKIHCPVGLQQVKGKYPMEVAVSIAAQLLPRIVQPSQSGSTGVYWRDAPQLTAGEPDQPATEEVTQG